MKTITFGSVDPYYFEDEEPEHNIQKTEIKTIKLFRGISNQTKTKELIEQSITFPGTLMGLLRQQQVIV